VEGKRPIVKEAVLLRKSIFLHMLKKMFMMLKKKMEKLLFSWYVLTFPTVQELVAYPAY